VLNVAGGTGGQPSDGDVRAALDALLRDHQFEASERRRRFLRYIVEATLEGRAGELKGYTIAVDVFDRDEAFDPQSDPIVRLEARRLRRDLDSYYMGAGAEAALRFTIPKGAYVPTFAYHNGTDTTQDVDQTDDGDGLSPPSPKAAEQGSHRSRRIWIAGIAACLFAGLAAIALIWPRLAQEEQSPPQPFALTVAVLPFLAVDASQVSRSIATGLTSELVIDLVRFQDVRVYLPPSNFSNDQGLATLRESGGVTYEVRGSVHTDGNGSKIAVQLLESVSGHVIWAQNYDVALAPDAINSTLQELSSRIAAALGQPYGAMSDDTRQRTSGLSSSNLDSYLCVLRAYGYRRTFSAADYGRLVACLETAVHRDPGYSDAWAMLGWLYLDAGRFELRPGDPDVFYEKGLDAANHAVTLEPDNILALKALSSILHYMGHYEQSEELARRALALNPYDPDTLAQLGWRLAVRGKFDEGIPYLQEAIARTIDPPGWYFHLISIHENLRRNDEAMLASAELAARDGSEISYFLLAIAAGELGEREVAAAALDRISPTGPVGRDPRAFLQRHGATPEIIESLLAGLQRAHELVDNGS
jgi:tetratricopeptide (TPR) repeat protein